MTKDFVKYLLEKPHSYIGVWSFIYANTDEQGVFHGNYQFILSRFQLSRTSLQRIIDYGCDFTQIGGQKVGRKWADKTLIVSMVTEIGGQKVGRKWAANSIKDSTENPSEKGQTFRKSTAKKEASGLYQKMIEQYDIFCNNKIGMGAKIDGLQGKSMKQIIEYLKAQVLKKQGNLEGEQLETEVVNAWAFILSHWDILDSFLSQQVKLNQINSNLPNILTQIRNGKQKSRNQKFHRTSTEIDGISFG